MTVGAVEPEAGRNVLDVGTDLEVVDPAAIDQTFSTRIQDQRQERKDLCRHREEVLAPLRVSGSGSKLEAVVFTREASRDVPEVVFTPRGRDREPTRRSASCNGWSHAERRSSRRPHRRRRSSSRRGLPVEAGDRPLVSYGAGSRCSRTSPSWRERASPSRQRGSQRYPKRTTADRRRVCRGGRS